MSFTTDALMKALESDIGRTKQPTDESSSKHWAAYSLQRNLVKKFTDRTISQLAERAAHAKFLHVNELVGKWVAPVDGPDPSLVEKILFRAKALAHNQFYGKDGPRINMAKAFNVGMVGPGAAVDAVADNIVDKLFNSKLSCTDPILYKFYLQAIANTKSWRKAELARAHRFPLLSIVKGNKLFFVSKETVIARTACTEPSLNMFGQLGYGTMIDTELLAPYHNIDKTIQPNINQWFAKSGSLNGESATIDLTSASDMVGLAYCRWNCPPEMMKDLELLRSPVTIFRGKEIPLNMISTMGNGFTFPLETWIFANLVLATMLETGEPVFDAYGKRRYSIHGDDIVCPTAIYDLLLTVLERAGFIPNRAKSYGTGKFRESCGADFFNGVNIRAVYLKTCTCDADIYGLINRLLDWTIRHKIVLPNTIRYLTSLVQFRPIPQYEDERCGIRVPLARLTSRKTSKHGNFFYYAVVQRDNKVAPEPQVVEEYYHGFRVALLHGSFRHGSMTPRILPGSATYKVVKCEANLHWDFVRDARVTSEERSNAFELHFPIRKV